MSETLPAVAGKRKLIEQYMPEFSKVLPAFLKSDRFGRVAKTAMILNPAIAGTTDESFIQCLLQLASFGLECDGRHAHLIPFKQKCTLVVDYKGLIAMAYRSGLVKSIVGEVVYENDEFVENLGRVQVFRPLRTGDRGEPILVFTHVEMTDGAESCEIMSKTDVFAIRDQYSQGYKRDLGNNRTDSMWSAEFPVQGEAWKKTCFRRHSKWLPLSSDFRDAVDRDADMPVPTRDLTADPGLTVGPAGPPSTDEPAPDVDKGEPAGEPAPDPTQTQEEAPDQTREPGDESKQEETAPPAGRGRRRSLSSPEKK